MSKPNWNSLTIAVLESDVAAVKTAISEGADPNLTNEDGSTALTWARTKEIVQLLAEQGATVESESPTSGITSLHNAVQCSDQDLASTLLELCNGRTAFNRVDEIGRTPLDIAAQIGSLDCVRLLVEAGADPNFVTSEAYSRTAQEYAKEKGHLAVVEYFSRGDK